MNRSGLIVLGAAIAILGYALLYSGLSSVNPSLSFTGGPVSTIDSLIPGKAGAKGGLPAGAATGAATTSRGQNGPRGGAMTPPGVPV